MVTTTVTSDSILSDDTDLSIAGWFLIIAAVWELLFNRISTALGLYGNVGAEGFLSALATSGRLAMNIVGVMALMLSCFALPQLARNPNFANLPSRIILMLASPLYLPVVCVAVFRPVLPQLVLVGYLISMGSTFFIAVLLAVGNLSGGSRRLILALGMITLLGALGLILSGSSEITVRKIYLLTEVIYVITPILAFLALKPGSFRAFFRRPHLPGLVLALLVATIALGVALYASKKTALTLFLVAFRTLGLTMGLPGGWILYIVALFLGSWLVGSLILPSRKWPTTAYSRRTGFGLASIWIAGIQPIHPYQFVLVLLGFLYLARGLPTYVNSFRKSTFKPQETHSD